MCNEKFWNVVHKKFFAKNCVITQQVVAILPLPEERSS